MKIKEKPEDFYVKEIINLDKKKEGDLFRYFLMKKENISTINAIKIIARKLHISKRKIYFAGEKDKNTISEQYICIRNFNDFREEYNFGNVKLKYVGSYEEPLKISDIDGNYFRIVIRDLNNEEIKRFKDNIEIFNKYYFNYFDEQRFGSRLNNHIVGKYLINRDYENAIRIILIDYNNENNIKAIEARKYLKEHWGDFKNALSLFPNYLDIERGILGYLIREKNYYRALKYIPKRLLKMYIHSYQSYLWNEELSYILKNNNCNSKINNKIQELYICKDNIEKFMDKKLELIGFDMKNKNFHKDILDREGLKIENLYNKDKPSLSLYSTERYILSEVKDVDYKIKNNIVIEFILGKGSFATIYIKHLFS
ncbi:tRNA pseudouridine synthase D [Nanobdella aerobiophila]|uniref:tRNA pseudouridine synthase D n=1 Tax=Nanobdella aerobiophila TaxID=2586965 RepID=A0A915WS01_9ARCH|nr:tRNA pseudouridine(13) synthase TruD [Nanobdella aerobiophila]BBL45819.1 tRNA pseudouridine synthase D [Nanobdella aerobiophila]